MGRRRRYFSINVLLNRTCLGENVGLIGIPQLNPDLCPRVTPRGEHCLCIAGPEYIHWEAFANLAHDVVRRLEDNIAKSKRLNDTRQRAKRSLPPWVAFV